MLMFVCHAMALKKTLLAHDNEEKHNLHTGLLRMDWLSYNFIFASIWWQ
jgi:hypothetical protein